MSRGTCSACGNKRNLLDGLCYRCRYKKDVYYGVKQPSRPAGTLTLTPEQMAKREAIIKKYTKAAEHGRPIPYVKNYQDESKD